MTQQDQILNLLKQAGSQGVNSYGMARDLALQLPRVMNDLKKAGYLWTTRKHKDRSVDYILISEAKPESRDESILALHTEEDCQIEEHYKAYVKNDRKFFEHVRETEQMTI